MLTGKHAANDGHVSMLVPGPFYLRSILPRKLLSLQLLLVRKRLKGSFVPGHIEILMHEVKYELEELLSVLLLINAPL